MTIDHSKYKLGRQPAKFDSRLPQFSQYLRAALPPAPASTNWRSAVSEWGLMGNDTLGDCTAASKIHAVQLWTANASKEANLTTADAIKFYSQTTGYDPADPSTDQGGVMLDVLNWWLKHDLAGHKIDAFANLDFNNRANIRDAVWLCGLADIGVNLPISAQAQEDWIVPPEGLKGDGEPASWGRHDCTIVDYDEQWVYISTWGLIKRASWEWVHAYCEEAYAILSKDWLRSNGVSPSGFDYNALVDDMKALDPEQDPIQRLRHETNDPVLFEFHWGEVTVDMHQAAATYVLGLIASAFATYGYMADSTISTFFGITIGVLAGFQHLAKIGSSNTRTKELVEVFADLIAVLQKRKVH